MPEVRDGMPCAPTRRTVLAALGLAAAAGPLAACGIRLEDDAPRVPLIPTREPVPGEAFLLGLWLGSSDLGAEAAALGGAARSLPARLATVHREQAEVLRSLLRSLGVPDRVVADAKSRHEARATAPPTTGSSTTAGSATTAGPSDSPSSTAASETSAAPSGGPTAPSRATLGAAEAAALSAEGFAELAALSRVTVVTPAAALAQRAAAATLLGQTPRWPTLGAVAPALAAEALDASRAAVYGMEVVAAQSQGAQRRLATATLSTLRARASVQQALAAGSASPAPLGYPLPFPVTNAGSARRLALHVLEGLRAGQAAAAAQAAGDVSALVAGIQWLAEAEVLCQRWGMDLEPFPGLK